MSRDRSSDLPSSIHHGALAACGLLAGALTALPAARAYECVYIQTTSQAIGYGKQLAGQQGKGANQYAQYLSVQMFGQGQGNRCQALTGLQDNDKTVKLGLNAENGNARYVRMNVPSGGNPIDAKNDGNAPYVEMNNVYNRLVSLNLPGHLFGIIDTNAAHHFTEPLARYAFRNTQQGHHKVVIQVDYHKDFVKGARLIRCQNWGTFALQNTADLYVFVGPNNPNKTQQVSGSFALEYWKRDGNNVPKDPTSAGQATQQNLGMNVHNAIRAAFPGQAPYDVYVTVDRDFHSYGMTPWPVYGKHTQNDARAAITSLVNGVSGGATGGTMVGLDVVGLPVTGGGHDSGYTPNSAFDDATTDLTTMKQLADQRL